VRRVLPKREHRRRVWGRRARKARQAVSKGLAVVRPLWLAGLGYGGAWLVVVQLRQEVWHHNMPVWAAGLFIAGWGVVGLYKEVSRRVAVRRWLKEESVHKVLDEAPRIRKMVDALPPWYLPKYLTKKREAKARAS
jgi:hypothetical protein